MEQIWILQKKKNRDKENDDIYRFIAGLVQATNNDTLRSLESIIRTKNMNLMARSLYMLFPAEIKANYAEFYKEVSEHKESPYLDNRAYKKYYDLSVEII